MRHGNHSKSRGKSKKHRNKQNKINTPSEVYQSQKLPSRKAHGKRSKSKGRHNLQDDGEKENIRQSLSPSAQNSQNQ